MAEHRFHTPGPIDLQVQIPSGVVHVETVDGDESFVSVVGDEKLVDQTRVELDGNRLVVQLEGKTSFGISITAKKLIPAVTTRL